VNYREGEGRGVCGNCAHFFKRVIDRFTTCEIFRPSDDDSVDPSYVCNFWTDGTTPKDTTSE
jgi:hypothetical protein